MVKKDVKNNRKDEWIALELNQIFSCTFSLFFLSLEFLLSLPNLTVIYFLVFSVCLEQAVSIDLAYITAILKVTLDPEAF